MVGLIIMSCLVLHLNHICREHFVCVEPGYVRGFKKLEPGSRWIGQQVLTLV